VNYLSFLFQINPYRKVEVVSLESKWIENQLIHDFTMADKH